MWNPWRTSCPVCETLLEMSKVSKIAFVLCFPIGFLYGFIAIYMEEIGHWVTINSLIYFVITAPIIIGIGILLWPLTKFQIKKR